MATDYMDAVRDYMDAVRHLMDVEVHSIPETKADWDPFTEAVLQDVGRRMGKRTPEIDEFLKAQIQEIASLSDAERAAGTATAHEMAVEKKRYRIAQLLNEAKRKDATATKLREMYKMAPATSTLPPVPTGHFDFHLREDGLSGRWELTVVDKRTGGVASRALYDNRADAIRYMHDTKHRERIARELEHRMRRSTLGASHHVVPAGVGGLAGAGAGGAALVGHHHTIHNIDDPHKEDDPFKVQPYDDTNKVILNGAISKATKAWADVEQALKYARRVLLWGPPGTGKSFAGVTNFAGRATQDVSRLYITLDTPSSEIRGHYLPNDKGTFSWHDGPASQSWRTGGRLIIDEIDAASGDVMKLLLGFLDDEEAAKMTLPTNETITPADGWQVIASTNEAPSGLPEPLLDRFDVVLKVEFPNPAAFIKDRWHSPEVCEAACRTIFLAKETPRGVGGRAIGLRGFRALDGLLGKGLDLEAAARLVVGDAAAEWLVTSINLAKTKAA